MTKLKTATDVLIEVEDSGRTVEEVAAEAMAQRELTECPDWATDTITFDECTPDVWYHHTRAIPSEAQFVEPHTEAVEDAEFILRYDTVDHRTQLEVGNEGIAWLDPQQARAFALALSKAADEWERLTGGQR
ncbi:hypothetical protein [Demequina sp.]|uniref:hypothetical protein n=1 Tax=Demequina sp. TaxID=2050685 RepID=UPI003A8892DD